MRIERTRMMRKWGKCVKWELEIRPASLPLPWILDTDLNSKLCWPNLDFEISAEYIWLIYDIHLTWHDSKIIRWGKTCKQVQQLTTLPFVLQLHPPEAHHYYIYMKCQSHQLDSLQHLVCWVNQGCCWSPVAMAQACLKVWLMETWLDCPWENSFQTASQPPTCKLIMLSICLKPIYLIIKSVWLSMKFQLCQAVSYKAHVQYIDLCFTFRISVNNDGDNHNAHNGLVTSTIPWNTHLNLIPWRVEIIG